MKFKKISDNKFQCILYKEDMKNYNISIEDFMHNDAAKIHELLDIVIEEAYEQIGIDMDGSVMSLQLVPQPNQSLLLTVSGRKEEGGMGLMENGANEITSFLNDMVREDEQIEKALENAIATEAMFGFSSMDGVEEFCCSMPELSGISSALYRSDDGMYMLVSEKGTASEDMYAAFLMKLSEFADTFSSIDTDIIRMKEHSRIMIKKDAVRKIREYCVA